MHGIPMCGKQDHARAYYPFLAWLSRMQLHQQQHVRSQLCAYLLLQKQGGSMLTRNQQHAPRPVASFEHLQQACHARHVQCNVAAEGYQVQWHLQQASCKVR